jgi:hypothetical protein
MERRFLVEAKSFVFSVLDVASVLRVEEKRKDFSGEVLLSNQCTEWLVSMMELLMGSSRDSDFVKSLGRGQRCQSYKRGGNKNGQFVEAATYGVGERRGFLLVPEGRRGWGWLKFVGELQKAREFLVATVGCGFGSSLPTEKVGNRPSFVEVVRAELCPPVTALFTSSRQGNLLGK